MAKRLLSSLLLAILFTSLVSGIAYGFLYRAPVAITENASISYDMLPVLWNQNNTWLAANGFMSSTANDTRVQTLGGLNKPWMVADNKTLTAIPVPADSQTNLYFVTGESEASAMDIIVGYGGYITRADDPDWEIGDNGSVAMSGYFDTSASAVGANWTSKEDAIRVYVSGTGNVTAAIYPFSASGVLQIKPNGAGDYTNIATANPAVDHYLNVDDPVGTPDDAATTVSTTTVAQQKDAYNLEAPTWLGSTQTVTAVNVVFRHSRSAVAGNIQPFLRLGASETAGTEIALGGWTTTNVTLARPGGGSWTTADIDTLQAVIGLRNDGANTSYCTQEYVEVHYNYSGPTVTASSVSSGVHTVTVGMDSPFLAIASDSTDPLLPVSNNIVMNAPLWQSDLSSSPFTTIDSVAHTGTVTDATWSSVGRTFASGNDRIAFEPTLELASSDFAITIWQKLQAGVFPSAGTNWDLIFDTNLSNAGFYYRISGATGKPMFGSYSPGSVQTAGDTAVSNNEWQQLDVTRSGGVITFTLNGVDMGNGSSGNHATIVASTSNLTIGYTTQSWVGIIGEVQIYNRALTPAERLQNYNATKWKYDGSTNKSGISTLASVPDNANDWVLTPQSYWDYYQHTVNATMVGWYQPTSMILTTVMPDRAGDAEDGVITWGANPAGVGVTLGSMTSSGQPSIGGASDTSTSDLLPPVGGTDWRPDASVSPQLQANPLRPIVTAISDNTTMSEYQVWVWFGIIFVVFITVLVGANVRGHHLITGIAASAAIVLMVVWTVFPLLSLLVVVLAILGGLVSERSPSL